MFEKTVSWEAKKSPHKEVLIEIWRLIKLHNAISLVDLTQGDLSDLADNLQQSYSVELVKRARDEIKSFYANKNLTLGVFLEKCLALKRSDEDHIKTQAMISPKSTNPLPVKKENLRQIKEMLANAVKPLPYNKSSRGHCEAYGATEEVPSVFDGLPDGKCYSDGAVLYQKSSSAGQVVPSSLISDPALKSLYEKAWTVGLMKEEKAQFDQLAKKFNKVG